MDEKTIIIKKLIAQRDSLRAALFELLPYADNYYPASDLKRREKTKRANKRENFSIFYRVAFLIASLRRLMTLNKAASALAGLKHCPLPERNNQTK